MPEAAVDVALVGPDQEPDGYGRLELQTAHWLCPMTHVFQNTDWKISLRHQMPPSLAIMCWLFFSPHSFARSHHYSHLATMYLLLATMYLLLATMFLLLATMFRA